MGIPFGKIEELIDICKKVDEKVYEDGWDKRIHVRDIGATLQKLIDDEMDYLDMMAEKFMLQEKENPFSIELDEKEQIPDLPGE